MFENFSRLSLTAGNPFALPCAASAAPRARRCESICISVAAAADTDDWVAVRPSRNTMNAANTRNVTISTPSTWNWLATGRWPITGSWRGCFIVALAVRNCSRIETEASGS